MADYIGKGYWGKCLEVDLTNKQINITDRHMQYIEDFAGGRALGMRLLWEIEKDNPGFDPMSDINPIMYIPGPCTGTAIAFGSRYEVVGKSALTRPLQSPYENASGPGFAACGGHFGPNLKWAALIWYILPVTAIVPFY